MQELYIKSLIILKQFNKRPTVKEWTRLAKQRDLMTAKTMCIMSGLDWNKLYGKVKKY